MKKMKLTLALLLFIVLLAGCTKNENHEAATPETTKTDTVTPGPEATTAAADDKAVDEAKNTEEAAEENTTDGVEPTVVPAEKLDMKIAALKGPTAIGMVKMMEEAGLGNTANNYQFTIAGTADEITAGLLKGDYDIAAVPCNLASVLYNKTEGQLKLAGINTLGVLYIVETGNSIQTVEDLKGKTIYSTGLGTTPQYTLNYLLNSYGIDPEKDVTIEYKAESTEVAAILNEPEDAIAMLPQPYVTTVLMSNENLRIALDVAKEWENASEDGSTVVTGVVVVRKEFLENNSEAFDAFMEEYRSSADFVNTSVEEASTLVEKHGIFKAAPIKKAIPLCNITLITGDEMKSKVEGYLKTLFDQNPKAVGGKLPAEDFYYIP